MGLFNWKHKEEKGDVLKDQTGLPPMGAHETVGEAPLPPAGMEKPTLDDVPMDDSHLEEIRPRHPEFKTFEPKPAPEPNKEMEIISLKLDTIRSTLESMDQRLKRIEKLAYGEDEQKW